MLALLPRAHWVQLVDAIGVDLTAIAKTGLAAVTFPADSRNEECRGSKPDRAWAASAGDSPPSYGS